MADRSITIKFLGDSSSLSKASHDAEVSVSGFDSALGSVAKTAAGFVVGAAITKAPGYLMDAAKAAAEDSANMEKLKTAVKNADGSYDGYNDAIQQAITDGQKKAFTDDQTRDALTTLINETGSTEEAMKRLGAAQDLARGTGMDLATAAKVLGKVSDENTSVLARYGIQVDKNATAQDVLNTVDAKFGGQAASFAATDAAKMQIMADKVSELQEQLGYYLLPALSLVVTAGLAVVDVFATKIVPAIGAVMDVVSPFTDLIANNLMPIFVALSPLLAGAAVVIAGALVSAFVSWAAATWAQVAAALALNASMLPWIALLAAIGVAVGLLYLAWQSNFLGIQDITMQVVGWVRDNVPPILQVAWDAIQAGLDAVSSAWNTVFPAIQAVVETVMPIISAVVTTYIAALRLEIETGINAAKAVFDTVFPLIQAVVETVMPIIATVVQTQITAVQTAIELGVAAAKLAFDTVFVPIQGVVEDVFNTIKGIIDTVWNGAGGAVAGVKSGIDTITGYFSNLSGTIGAAWDTAWSAMAGSVIGVWEGIEQTVRNGISIVTGLINSLIDGYNSTLGRIPGAPHIGHVGSGISGPAPPEGFDYGQNNGGASGGSGGLGSAAGVGSGASGGLAGGQQGGSNNASNGSGGASGSSGSAFGPLKPVPWHSPANQSSYSGGSVGLVAANGTPLVSLSSSGAGSSAAQALWVRIHPDDLRQLTGEGF